MTAPCQASRDLTPEIPPSFSDLSMSRKGNFGIKAKTHRHEVTRTAKISDNIVDYTVATVSMVDKKASRGFPIAVDPESEEKGEAVSKTEYAERLP